MKPRSIFIFAGELSGDLHGEKLIHALKKEDSSVKIFGVGGPKMRTTGMECLVPTEKFQVMGFLDVFFALPRLATLFFSLRKKILEKKPDIILFIDYPGFSLALAKSLRKKGSTSKICHYICPSVWAWGKKRIPKMEKILDHLFVIFPFEQALFNREKLKVHYVGNPLKENLTLLRTTPLDIDPKFRVVALFPGSREKELVRNFPIHLNVAKKLLAKYPDLYFAVSVAQPSFSLKLDQILKMENFGRRDRILLVNSSQNASLFKRATLAIAKSGTNNLELALHRVPTVVTYRISPFDLFIAKNLLKINLPYYCITNIVANREVFPELIGPNLTEEALFSHADRFLSSKEAWNGCREKCQDLDKILETKTPEREISKILLNEKSPP